MSPIKRETIEEALENDCPGDCRPEDHCGEHSEPGRDWSGLAGPEADPRSVATVAVPAHLLEGALADALCQRDREMGEDALFAPPGSPLARPGETRVAMWAARNAGLAALLKWASAR